MRKQQKYTDMLVHTATKEYLKDYAFKKGITIAELLDMLVVNLKRVEEDHKNEQR